MQYAEARVQYLTPFKKNKRLITNQLKHRSSVSQIKIGEGYPQMRGLVGNIFHSTTTYSLFIKSLQKPISVCGGVPVGRRAGTGGLMVKSFSQTSQLWKGVESGVLNQMQRGSWEIRIQRVG